MSITNRLIKTIFYPLLITLMLTGCSTEKPKAGVKSYFDANAPADLESEVVYAKGFDIYRWSEIIKVVVYHPEIRKMVIGEYFIVPAELAGKFDDSTNMIIAPADSIAVFSATQLNALDKLDKLDCVVGISESKYIINPNVREKLAKGEIHELATLSDFFVEKTISVNPSMIFYSPFKVTESHSLDVTGIPLIFYYDYFEMDPLGRAEWLYFLQRP